MPAYTYACNDCGTTFNVRLSYADLDSAHPACPDCEGTACERLLSRVSVAVSGGSSFEAASESMPTAGGGCCGGTCGCSH